MDNLMMLFSESVQNRYQTVLENIKNSSNSFYDSYNSLVEQFIRSICKNDVKGSITNLLNDQENKTFFLDEVHINVKTYSKILDLARKINQHKHKKEHQINLDIVLTYLKTFYDFVYDYSLYVKYTIPSFDENYFKNIFGINKKSQQELTEFKDVILNLENKYNEAKEKEEQKIKRQNFINEVLHCGNYGYESFYSLQDFKKAKNILYILFSICGIMLVSGCFLLKGDNVYLLVYIVPFLVFYLYRFIEFIFSKKFVKCDFTGKNKFTYTTLASDKTPLETGEIKVSHYIWNAIFIFLLLISTNILYIIVSPILIYSLHRFFKLKKSYMITCFLSRRGVYFYSCKDNCMVEKLHDGSFKPY